MKETRNKIEMKGIPASPGIAIGSAYVLTKNKVTSTGTVLKSEDDIAREMDKFNKAVQASVDDIERVKSNASQNLNEDEMDVLDAHIELLTDPQLHGDVLEKIRAERKNAVDAVIQVIGQFIRVFKGMNDAYLIDRAADIKDIGNRILENLSNSREKTRPKFKFNTIVIADEISPSDAIALDMTTVIAFATRIGGKTSHTAILAKSKNLPAVLGCGAALDEIRNDDVIIVDGAKGLVIANPDEKCFEEYAAKFRQYHQENSFMPSLNSAPAQTTDGNKIKLMANISSADDMDDALRYGAEGVGLFRTELLFMNRNSFPTEDEQFQFYYNAALKARGKPVVIRTIDIGGDKPLDYFHLPKEENPFLGYRAIRISLDRKDIFVTQLKAILRASALRNVKAMFPMISGIQELRLAKQILEAAKQQLRESKVDFDERIPVGMMIETPSAAITADLFAKEVDFFSIGTNDLCQYTLAVDRGNEKIKDLYDPYNPAVLRLIRYMIEQARKYHIHVGMCGEFASDPLATVLLLGMGLEEFSMSAVSLPPIKKIINENDYEKAKMICEQVMSMDNSKSIIDYLTASSSK